MGPSSVAPTVWPDWLVHHHTRAASERLAVLRCAACQLEEPGSSFRNWIHLRIDKGWRDVRKGMIIISEACSVRNKNLLVFWLIFLWEVFKNIQKYIKLYVLICQLSTKNQIMDNLASLSSNSFPSILFWNKSQTVGTRLFYFNIITELLSQLKNLITNFLSKFALNVTLRH